MVELTRVPTIYLPSAAEAQANASAETSAPAAQATVPAQETDSYVLGTGELARQRLQVSEEAYGWATTSLVRGLRAARPQIWPQSPMRMAVVACGTGSQLPNLAALAGPGVSLWCSDANQAQLDVAQRAAAQLGAVDVHFERVDLEQAAQPGSFDVVHARFVLVHLRRPEAALRNMWQMVAPKGLLVSEEHAIDGIEATPSDAAVIRAKGWLQALGAQRGVDFDLGLKVPQLFSQVGVPVTGQQTYRLGFTEGAPKRLLELSLREAKSSYVDANIASAAELDATCAALGSFAERSDTRLCVGQLTQTWAKRPG